MRNIHSSDKTAHKQVFHSTRRYRYEVVAFGRLDDGHIGIESSHTNSRFIHYKSSETTRINATRRCGLHRSCNSIGVTNKVYITTLLVQNRCHPQQTSHRHIYFTFPTASNRNLDIVLRKRNRITLRSHHGTGYASKELCSGTRSNKSRIDSIVRHPQTGNFFEHSELAAGIYFTRDILFLHHCGVRRSLCRNYRLDVIQRIGNKYISKRSHTGQATRIGGVARRVHEYVDFIFQVLEFGRLACSIKELSNKATRNDIGCAIREHKGYSIAAERELGILHPRNHSSKTTGSHRAIFFGSKSLHIDRNAIDRRVALYIRKLCSTEHASHYLATQGRIHMHGIYITALGSITGDNSACHI